MTTYKYVTYCFTCRKAGQFVKSKYYKHDGSLLQDDYDKCGGNLWVDYMYGRSIE